MNNPDINKPGSPAQRIRVDKWLWAARFFKTRAKARQAIDGGKVHLGSQRAKASKEITVGDLLRVRQGYDEKIVRVLAISDQRRGAPEAAQLYEETPESIEARLLAAEQRRAAGQLLLSDSRPSKKDRRLIHKFRDRFYSESDQ
ncbi:MAG: S4 domain-containing protein [Gammaproteobacteria bacterium]|nr:S4 domain-containing protein [Gammaproteobacteria bacterium]